MARRKAPAVARGSRARSAELNGRRRREAAVAQTGKTRAGPRLKPARTLSSRACAAPAAEAACDPETAARRGVDFINRQTGRAVTQFQWRVYSLCKQIPKGQVSTYKLISDALNSSPRAVGNALRANPFAPDVPCHRVLSSTFFIGGFSGQWGAGDMVEKKKKLLEQEGMCFEGYHLTSDARTTAVFRDFSTA